MVADSSWLLRSSTLLRDISPRASCLHVVFIRISQGRTPLAPILSLIWNRPAHESTCVSGDNGRVLSPPAALSGPHHSPTVPPPAPLPDADCLAQIAATHPPVAAGEHDDGKQDEAGRGSRLNSSDCSLALSSVAIVLPSMHV